MLIPPNKLSAFLGSRDPVDVPRPQRTPLPYSDGVLYAGPNPDGTRKQCAGCYKWIVSGACVEVAGEINPTMVCGYHVFGKPQPSVPIGAAEKRRMTPADAGLIETPSGTGTSCDRCRFFEPSAAGAAEGLCNAVASRVDAFPPVVVDGMGCCARWEWLPTR